MIEVNEIGSGFRMQFSNQRVQSIADMPVEKGGDGAGFRPHELLEAALAACIGMTLRMAADKHGIALPLVSLKVTLDREDPAGPVLDYTLDLPADLAQSDRERLERAVANCPVSQTLAAAPRIRQTASLHS